MEVEKIMGVGGRGREVEKLTENEGRGSRRERRNEGKWWEVMRGKLNE